MLKMQFTRPPLVSANSIIRHEHKYSIYYEYLYSVAVSGSPPLRTRARQKNKAAAAQCRNRLLIFSGNETVRSCAP